MSASSSPRRTAELGGGDADGVEDSRGEVRRRREGLAERDTSGAVDDHAVRARAADVEADDEAVRIGHGTCWPSLSALRSTLPFAVFGSAPRKRTSRGALCGESSLRTWPMQLERERLQVVALRRRDHEGARHDQPVLLVADDRALAHPGMGEQAALDLERSDPDPTHLEQVVGAAAVPEVPVGVPLEEVAGAHPAARERPCRSLLVSLVAPRHARPTHVQLARRAVRKVVALVVDDPGLVARHELVRRCRCGRAPGRFET